MRPLSVQYGTRIFISKYGTIPFFKEWQPQTDGTVDNANTTSPGSEGSWLRPFTSPVEEKDGLPAAENEPDQSAVRQRGDEDYHWYETIPDPALWRNISSDKIKTNLIERGPSLFHNRRAKYPASARHCGLGGRVGLLRNYMCRRLPNGQVVPRQWLLYTPSTGHVFCFACKLFGTRPYVQHANTDAEAE